MIKIEIFNGSPRKKGNTTTLIDAFNKELDKSQYISNTNFLYDYRIEPCTDCRACKKGNLVCKVKDDMQDMYKRIDDSDVIIIATPIYWFGPTAKMKLLLDRLRPYYGNGRLKGKKAALLLVAGVGEKDCDLTIKMYSRAFKALGVALIGSVTSKAYDIGETEKDELAMKAVKKLVQGNL